MGTKETMRGYYEQHYTNEFGRLGKMTYSSKNTVYLVRLKQEEIENPNGSKSVEDIDPESGNHKSRWLLANVPNT